jgi:hypothetical protein
LAAIFSGLVATLAVAQSPRTSPYRPPLKAFAYLPQKDDFLRHESVVAPRTSKRPGGEISYYGNRLTQFRYVGPPQEGGYYDAWSDYARRRKLDAGNYQYRSGLP